MLVAKIGKQLERLAKHQLIGSVTPQPQAMLPTRVTAVGVVVITTKKLEKATEDASASGMSTPNGPPEVIVVATAERDEHLETGISTQNPVKAPEELDLSHVPSSNGDRLRHFPLEFTTIWYRSLGKIKTINSRTDWLRNTKLFSHLYNRAGPKATEKKASQVERIPWVEVIEQFHSPRGLSRRPRLNDCRMLAFVC